MDTADKRHTQIGILMPEDVEFRPRNPDTVPSPTSPYITKPGKAGKLHKKGFVSGQDTVESARRVLSRRPRSDRILETTWGSPWEQYRRSFKFDLGGLVHLARRKTRPYGCVLIREFPVAKAEETLYWFRRIRHSNITTALEVFVTDDFLHVVLEEMAINLARIVKCPAYPDEDQLSCILGQILDGLSYLESEGLEFPCLSCDNVLLSLVGDVKITSQERCRNAGDSEHPHVKAVESITMRLMHKYPREDFQRWPRDSNASMFLAAAKSGESVTRLLKHPLVGPPRQKEVLMDLVRFAQVSVLPDYQYGP